ncbi:MAG: Smr/MutS family protein [Betaproteobacteria bacterium]
MNSLADLKQVKAQIAEEQAQRVREQAAQKLAKARSQAQQTLFRAAIGTVQPLPDPGRASIQRKRPAPLALQLQRDEQAVLRSSLSDEFDGSSLLDTDTDLSYAQAGLSAEVTRKLRRGVWAVQAELDLHGLRTEDAREALAQFVRDAHKRGLRCVRVVHGKGLGSPGKTPVLKSRVHSWLMQKSQVLAYVQARPAQGGAGALLVLLQPG